MAGNALTDMLGFGAAQALGKASGQDFLTPMLEQTRQKDMFLFQQRQFQEAADKERKRAKEERTETQRGLLRSLKAVGAFSDEDYTAIGGIEEAASMAPDAFEVLLSQMSQNKQRSLSAEERRKFVIARAAAEGFTVHPDADERTILEVEQRLALRALDKQDRKETQAAAKGTVDRSLNAAYEAFASANQMTVTMADVAALDGNLTRIASQVANQAEDLGPDAETFMTRATTGRKALGPLVVAAEANDRDKKYEQRPLSFFEDYSTMSAELRQAVDQRPQAKAIRDTTAKNFERLTTLSQEAAEIGGVGPAWAAAHGKESFEALMRMPDHAAAVYGSKVDQAFTLIQQHGETKAATDEAEQVARTTAASYQLLGVEPADVDPADFIRPTWTPNGLQVKFQEQAFAAAYATKIAERKMTTFTAKSLAGSEGVPPELRNAAKAHLLDQLQSDNAIEQLATAQQQVDQHFEAFARNFGETLANLETVDMDPVREAKADWPFVRFLTPGVRGSDPDRIEFQAVAPLIQQGERLWRMRDYRDEARSFVEQAQAEQREYAGIKPIEEALAVNLESAQQAALAEEARGGIRSVFTRAGLTALSDGSASSELDEGDGDPLAWLKVPEEATSAEAFVVALQSSVSGKEQYLGKSNIPVGNLLSEDAGAFSKVLSDEVAHWMSVAKAIDNGLRSEEHRKAIYDAVKASRNAPAWLDSPEKLPMYLLLTTADRASQ